MKHWKITDPGLVRRENQDAFGFAQLSGGYIVAVVCDGMGGVAGGSIASSVAVETYIRTLSDSDHPDQAVRAAVMAANSAIRQRAAGHPELRSMGTTLVSALVKGDRVLISNVGDSRAYYITEAGITRITKDHSLVETMVDHGDITADEARRHPGRNLITRALGRDTNAACDGYIRPMEQGDFILLCTDGLVNTVTDQEMLFEIVHGGDLDTCLDRLLHISKSQGAPDNVTAVLMQKL